MIRIARWILLRTLCVALFWRPCPYLTAMMTALVVGAVVIYL